MGDPGDGLFPWRVSLNEAISCRPLPECLADTLIGEIGAEKVNIRLGQSQIDGKPGLVFAVAGSGYKSVCKFFSILPKGTDINFLLFLLGAPAAYRCDKIPAIQFLHQFV